MVDIVCGPDAYRDLPRLLTESSSTNEAAGKINLWLANDACALISYTSGQKIA